MTVGWRSPLGGPRYDGPIPGDSVEEWPEERIDAEVEEHRRAEATVEADGGLRADGGNVHAQRVAEQLAMAEDEPDLEEIHVGDHVRDRDADDDTTMLVVGTPIEQAGEYELGDGQTVADVNPEYPADDDVLECVFPSRTDVSTRPLSRYAYPRSRLEIVGTVHEEGDDE